METDKVRELIHNLAASKLERGKDGTLTIPNVTMLAAGTWVDSSWGTPLCYSEEILKEYAENWFDNPLWSRHGGGSPRSVTDKIGEIVNQHYNEGAVVADLVLHGKTQTSNDVIELITNGLVNAISVEHGGTERWDPDTQEYIAEEVIFYGAAIVNKGACSVCTINNEASRTSRSAEADMEQKELETKLAEAEDKIKELSEDSATMTQIKELEAKITEADQHDKITELEAKITELEGKLDGECAEKIKELEGRLETVEKTPMKAETLIQSIEDFGTIDLSATIRDAEGMTRRTF